MGIFVTVRPHPRNVERKKSPGPSNNLHVSRTSSFDFSGFSPVFASSALDRGTEVVYSSWLRVTKTQGFWSSNCVVKTTFFCFFFFLDFSPYVKFCCAHCSLSATYSEPENKASLDHMKLSQNGNQVNKQNKQTKASGEIT